MKTLKTAELSQERSAIFFLYFPSPCLRRPLGSLLFLLCPFSCYSCPKHMQISERTVSKSSRPDYSSTPQSSQFSYSNSHLVSQITTVHATRGHLVSQIRPARSAQAIPFVWHCFPVFIFFKIHERSSLYIFSVVNCYTVTPLAWAASQL